MGGAGKLVVALVAALPAVAEPAQAPVAATPGAADSRPAMTLNVFPSATRAQRRTRFRFVVRARIGARVRRVPGALVRFAGRRVRTNARGRAAVSVTFPHRTRRRVLVTKRGLRPVAFAVRVLPRLKVERGELDEREAPCTAGRWPVKTVTDRRARLVDPRPIPISVSALWLKRPPRRVGFSTPRLRGVERHVFRIKARLVAMQLEPDRDIHLIVAAPGHPRRTMITELVHPNCRSALRSRFARRIRRARAAFARACGVATRRQRRIVGSAILTGVGFWDSRHGQFGVARNAIELHPVLGYESRGCRPARGRARARRG